MKTVKKNEETYEAKSIQRFKRCTAHQIESNITRLVEIFFNERKTA